MEKRTREKIREKRINDVVSSLIHFSSFLLFQNNDRTQCSIRLDFMFESITNSDDYSTTNSSLTSTLCQHINCTNDLSSSLRTNLFSNSHLIILILSILCFFGVCFMLFGPLQRSEAYKRVENFTFGRHPIFNIDHREVSTTTRYDESMEFSNI